MRILILAFPFFARCRSRLHLGGGGGRQRHRDEPRQEAREGQGGPQGLGRRVGEVEAIVQVGFDASRHFMGDDD